MPHAPATRPPITTMPRPAEAPTIRSTIPRLSAIAPGSGLDRGLAAGAGDDGAGQDGPGPCGGGPYGAYPRGIGAGGAEPWRPGAPGGPGGGMAPGGPGRG